MVLKYQNFPATNILSLALKFSKGLCTDASLVHTNYDTIPTIDNWHFFAEYLFLSFRN
jgi:hypothetical protein